MRILLLSCLILTFGYSADAQSLPAPVKQVFTKYACASCHVMEKRMLGPSWQELAKKKYSAKKMTKLIRKPKPSNWPNFPPMAPIANISDAEVKVVADWLSKLK